MDGPSGDAPRTVTIVGRVRGVSTMPPHIGTRYCGGGAVYDSQTFTLHDKTGSIAISTTGTCRPNVIKPVAERELVQVRGVVIADRSDPTSMPLIMANKVERVKR